MKIKRKIKFAIIVFIVIFLVIFVFHINKNLAKNGLCLGTFNSKFNCYENYYINLINNNGVKAAFLDLKDNYDKNFFLQSECHPLMHVIGRAVANQLQNISKAFSQGDSFCWSGYYHGLMEGIVEEIGVENLLKDINTICASIPGKEWYSFDYYNCVHGLGHGIMAITNDELFKSLEYCDYLTGSWEKSSCYGGVFMENIIFDDRTHFSKYLKPNDPFYPCNAVDEKYKGSCYLMQTSHMLDVADWDFAKVFELCSQVEDNYVDTCYQSLGRDASGQSLSDIKQTKDYCLLGRDFRQQYNCIIGAVMDFVYYYHSETQAKQLCLSLPFKLQKDCLKVADGSSKNL